MNNRNIPHVGCNAVESKSNHCVQNVVATEHNDNRNNVKVQVHQCRTLTVLGRTHGGQHCGDTSTDILTHDDRDGDTVRDRARRGQRLQNTDGCRGGLHDRGQHGTCKNAKEGIFKHDQQLAELGNLLEHGNRIRHDIHTRHQHAKAQKNKADLLISVFLCKHTEHNADQGKDRHPEIRLEILQPCHNPLSTCNLHAGHRGQPCGHGSAHISAENHTDSLCKRHGCGVDKAHDHDRGSRGRLNDGSDTQAQQKALELVGGQLAENDLKSVTRTLFKSIAHDVHTEQEQRKAKQQIEHHENVNALVGQHSLQIVQQILHFRILSDPL